MSTGWPIAWLRVFKKTEPLGLVVSAVNMVLELLSVTCRQLPALNVAVSLGCENCNLYKAPLSNGQLVLPFGMDGNC